MAALETGRPYLSIGEVLNILKSEFEDITVSKIRYLESEDLIHPERTSSGYRKFSQDDIERLRFILKLQRDHFLPLKVIRERLADWEASGGEGGQSTLSFEGEESPSQEKEPAPARVEDRKPDLDAFMRAGSGMSLDRAEFLKTCSLTEGQLAELENHRLIRPKDLGDGDMRYDENAVEIAKLSGQLIELGLEPRHLRMFESTVDRWASLAEQMVLPLHKQRNPEARAAAQEMIRELVRVGTKLMQTLLRDALAPYV